MKRVIGFLISLTLPLSVPAVSAEPPSLHVLSMNTFMIPKPIKMSMQEIRTPLYVEQIKKANFEILFFQEAFWKEFRTKVAAGLKEEFPFTHYLDGEGALFPVFGSGIFILSRYPFKVLDQVFYKDCTDSDCYAAKGALLIELTLPSGKLLQFASTHMQAGGKGENGPMRISQIRQIKTMMQKHARPDIPQFLIGDLNIDDGDEQFSEALSIMEMNFTPLVGPIQKTSGRTNDCYDVAGKNKRWIDHIWTNAKDLKRALSMQVRVMDFPYQGKICPLSDHHGVEAQFFF